MRVYFLGGLLVFSCIQVGLVYVLDFGQVEIFVQVCILHFLEVVGFLPKLNKKQILHVVYNLIRLNLHFIHVRKCEFWLQYKFTGQVLMVHFTSLAISLHKGRLNVCEPTGVLYDIQTLQPIRVVINDFFVNGLNVKLDFLECLVKNEHGLGIDPLDELVDFGDLFGLAKLEMVS